MTNTDIQQIIERRAWPGNAPLQAMHETHISWVLVTSAFAWKIKKPVRFSFLDFSTLELRHKYCMREVVLNSRLSKDVYLGVVPVRQHKRQLQIGGTQGTVVDYAVQMKTLDASRRMDLLVEQQAVSDAQLRQLAQTIAAFHLRAERVAQPVSAALLYEEFADLLEVQSILSSFFDTATVARFAQAVAFAKTWLDQHADHFIDRFHMGWVVDGHGDLHTRNIFLLEQPVIFDCIEFNDGLRQLDVLNEMAFLGMDLNYYGAPQLERKLMHYYLYYFPCIRSQIDWRLYRFFKWYRANVRLKVYCLSFRPDEDPAPQQVEKLHRYAQLFFHYFERLRHPHGS